MRRKPPRPGVTQCTAAFAIMLCAAWGSPSSAGERPDSATPFLAQAPAESPCDDSLYIELRKKSLDQMSQREYEFFLQKDQQCGEYRKWILTRGDRPTPSASPLPGSSPKWPRDGEGELAQEPAVNGAINAVAIVVLSVFATIGTLLFLVAISD